MAQSIATKALPPLAELLPDYHGFLPTATRSRQLHDWLAALARRLRENRERPFYSLHDVAGFFGLAVSTVAEVYAALEREGLLLRRRGAVTVICPRQTVPRVPLRGVVAVPIWSLGFLNNPDIRVFYRQLEEAIRARDFVMDQIFFRQGEDVEPPFVERVLDHHPDYLLWLRPPSSARENIASIRQTGVRSVVIGAFPAFAEAPYTLRTERGTRQALAAWHRAGIRSVVMPGWEATIAGPIRQALAAVGLRWSATNPTRYTYTDKLDDIAASPHVGVWFADEIWFALLCQTQPDSVARLLRRVRSLVTCPINLPSPHVRGLRVDAVLMDWMRVAERLARDLGDQRLGLGGKPVVFEAGWHPQMPATQLTAHFGRD